MIYVAWSFLSSFLHKVVTKTKKCLVWIQALWHRDEICLEYANKINAVKPETRLRQLRVNANFPEAICDRP